MHTSQFGAIVATHRKHAKLTQKQLGDKVGYGKGSAVTISRIENGKTIPGVTRVADIADALDLTDAQADELLQLRDEAVRKLNEIRNPVKKESLRTRKEQLEQQLQKRVQIIEEISAANQHAIELASSNFFNQLIDSASQINGAPIEHLKAVKIKELSAKETPLLLRARQQLDHITQNLIMSFTGVGPKILSDAIGGAAGGAVTGGYDAYVTYTTIARHGHASTGMPNSTLHGIALKKSVQATMGGGTLANGGGGIAGGVRNIYGTIAGGAIVGLMNALAASAAQAGMDRYKVSRQLTAQEIEFQRTESRFHRWQSAVKRSTDLLTYIGIHGAHALKKWQESLGPLPLGWSELTEQQKKTFQEMMTIAACESTIDMTPTDQIMSCGDQELAEVEAEIDASFTASEITVKTLV